MNEKELFRLSCDMAGMQIFGDKAILSIADTKKMSFVINDRNVTCADTNKAFKWNLKKNNRENYARFSRFLFFQTHFIYNERLEDYYKNKTSALLELRKENNGRKFTDNLGVMYRILKESNIPPSVLASAFRTAFGENLFITFVSESEYREKRVKELTNKQEAVTNE